MSDHHNRPRAIDRSAGDEVERLVRLAGRRPAVPAEHAASVKAAARAEWQRTVKARRQRRLTPRGGALLAAAALVLLMVKTDFWRRIGPTAGDGHRDPGGGHRPGDDGLRHASGGG